jgi:hypothetical protein
VGVRLIGPKGANIRYKTAASSDFLPADDMVVHFQIDKASRAATSQECDIKLSNFPGHEQTEAYGRLRVEPPAPATAHYLYSRSIPIDISPDELSQALSAGPIVKAIYLVLSADSDKAPLAAVETISTSDGKTMPEAIQEARKRGHVLALLSIGKSAVTYVGGRDKMTAPPTPQEVMAALPALPEAHGFIVEPLRKYVRITIEQIVNTLEDEERHDPMVGPASLHRLHFKCTARYHEVIKSDWPVPFRHDNGEKTNVVYIDYDRRTDPQRPHDQSGR